MATEPTFSSLAEHGVTEHTMTTKEQQRRHYVRSLHRVIDEADVVLLVLDARDPAGCRSRLVEDEVRRREGEGKRLIFVLNKIGALSSVSIDF